MPEGRIYRGVVAIGLALALVAPNAAVASQVPEKAMHFALIGLVLLCTVGFREILHAVLDKIEEIRDSETEVVTS